VGDTITWEKVVVDDAFMWRDNGLRFVFDIQYESGEHAHIVLPGNPRGASPIRLVAKELELPLTVEEHVSGTFLVACAAPSVTGGVCAQGGVRCNAL
jgi:hypothetical protein